MNMMKLWRILTIAVLGFALAVASWPVPARADAPYDQALDQAVEDAQRDAGDLRRDVSADLAPARADEAEAHEAVAHDVHAEANADPLEWKTDLALWTAVVFLVLLVVLWRFAWGPIADGLARRERSIANQISEAQQANQDAQRLLVEHQKKLDAASDEVRQLIAQGRRDAEQSGQRIVEAARAEAKAEHEKALTEIDRATSGAIAELAAKSAELAVGLAGKIVQTQLRPSDHERLVREAVAGFTAGRRKRD